MRKLYLLIWSFGLILGNLAAQNMVSNPGFENYSTCNSAFSSIISWTNPDTATPDFYHGCAPSLGGLGFSVPANAMGYQNAHGGSGYIGLVSYEDAPLFGCPNPIFATGWREYAQIQLTSPLVAGQNYCAEFYVSLSDKSRYSISSMGMYFSNTQVYLQTALALPFSPQISNTSGQLADTLGWTKISGSYTATGGEQYIIIGNFKNDGATSPQCFNSGSFFPYAYYFVDDVFVGLSGTCPQDCQITASISVTNPSCSTSSAILSANATGASGPLNYFWNTGSTSQTLTGQPAGTYIVTISDTSGCSASDTVVISNPVPLSISLGPDQYICQGQSVTLTVNGGNSWQWSNGSTTQSITVAPPSDWNYSVTATNSSGCTASDTVFIGINYPPTVKVDPPFDTVWCNTDPDFALIWGFPGGGVWSGSGVVNGNFSPSTAGIGAHMVYYTVTDSNGCQASDSMLVNVSSCTGLNEGIASRIQVYPNPSNGQFMIEGQGITGITVYDALGREVKNLTLQKHEPGLEITLKDAGIYRAVIWVGEQRTVVGLVVTN
ncbi:MAG: T9SS type A sorting domain-containing protein [Bacteroidia bacterium]|nr:T9SS type A sorting domain-containing protein [Bacteroidia bacterium]